MCASILRSWPCGATSRASRSATRCGSSARLRDSSTRSTQAWAEGLHTSLLIPPSLLYNCSLAVISAWPSTGTRRCAAARRLLRDARHHCRRGAHLLPTCRAGILLRRGAGEAAVPLRMLQLPRMDLSSAARPYVTRGPRIRACYARSMEQLVERTQHSDHVPERKRVLVERFTLSRTRVEVTGAIECRHRRSHPPSRSTRSWRYCMFNDMTRVQGELPRRETKKGSRTRGDAVVSAGHVILDSSRIRRPPHSCAIVSTRGVLGDLFHVL